MMPEYVLFSPLGMSDPSRGYRDGAFIHICRAYKPKKVYLYMSAEICAFDRLDNRYEAYLNRLAEKLDFKCAVEKIMYPELMNVSDFDAFYEDFSRIIKRISDENPGAEVLLNISSGTPQMKSALKIVSNLNNRRLTIIQVLSPVERSNLDPPVDGKYDIDLEWEFNEDNIEENPRNRCIITKSENFNALIKHEIIAKHIAVYDYKAALTVAQTIPDFIDSCFLKLLMAGERRLALDTGNAGMLARSVGYDLLPVKDRGGSNKAKIAFEYILALKIKLEKGELADFVRAISPILTDIFELYLKNRCRINIEDYLSGPSGSRTAKLSRSRLTPELLQILDKAFYLNGGYRDKEPCAANLCPLIIAKGEGEAIDMAVKLSDFEYKARHIAAHEIVTVTEKWLKETACFETGEIFKMLKDFLSISTPISRDAWESYERLNEAIMAFSMLR